MVLLLFKGVAVCPKFNLLYWIWAFAWDLSFML